MSARVPADVRRLPLRVRLAAALETLTDRDRLVLALRLLDGLTTLETAGALRLRAAEVESRLDGALRVVRDELGLARLRRAA